MDISYLIFYGLFYYCVAMTKQISVTTFWFSDTIEISQSTNLLRCIDEVGAYVKVKVRNPLMSGKLWKYWVSMWVFCSKLVIICEKLIWHHSLENVEIGRLLIGIFMLILTVFILVVTHTELRQNCENFPSAPNFLTNYNTIFEKKHSYSYDFL